MALRQVKTACQLASIFSGVEVQNHLQLARVVNDATQLIPKDAARAECPESFFNRPLPGAEVRDSPTDRQPVRLSLRQSPVCLVGHGRTISPPSADDRRSLLGRGATTRVLA